MLRKKERKERESLNKKKARTERWADKLSQLSRKERLCFPHCSQATLEEQIHLLSDWGKYEQIRLDRFTSIKEKSFPFSGESWRGAAHWKPV